MKILWTDKKIDYDGSQLRPHWIYKNFNLIGNAAVAFVGGCRVSRDDLVDLADQKAGSTIFSEEMLHLLVELFDSNLREAILLQRLLVSLLQQEITFRSKRPTIVRAGNDLYDGDAKLSVSVATVSPVSSLIHLGVNVSSRNTPVKTNGLVDLQLDPKGIALSLLETFRHEVESVEMARAKVRSV